MVSRVLATYQRRFLAVWRANSFIPSLQDGSDVAYPSFVYRISHGIHGLPLTLSKIHVRQVQLRGLLLCAATRGGIIHVVLTFGTNNMSAAVRAKTNFIPVDIYRRTIGSKLTITNRPIYNL
jgi:hypothetical protein